MFLKLSTTEQQDSAIFLFSLRDARLFVVVDDFAPTWVDLSSVTIIKPEDSVAILVRFLLDAFRWNF